MKQNETARGAEMKREEIQQQIEELSQQAAQIWTREESRKFSDKMRRLKAELKGA